MIEVTIRYSVVNGEGRTEYYVNTPKDAKSYFANFKTSLWVDAINTALRVFARELPEAQVLTVQSREVNDATLIP